MTREDGELVVKIFVVPHVCLRVDQQTAALQRADAPRQRVGRHVRPTVRGLEEVCEGRAEEPEQALGPGGTGEASQASDHWNQHVDVRDVSIPRNADDRGRVVVVVLKAARKVADPWQPKGCVVQDQVDDPACKIHVEEARHKQRRTLTARQGSFRSASSLRFRQRCGQSCQGDVADEFREPPVSWHCSYDGSASYYHASGCHRGD
mmetsp:Transcript_12475/g.32254  ORF Transcript_12475/g.32254 Transcript_12475/m.32254 type:complete len:206 (+) Transcript_12475:290-907(+)